MPRVDQVHNGRVSLRFMRDLYAAGLKRKGVGKDVSLAYSPYSIGTAYGINGLLPTDPRWTLLRVIACFLAHWKLETGENLMSNWNIANVRYMTGEERYYFCYDPKVEHVTPAEADELLRKDPDLCSIPDGKSKLIPGTNIPGAIFGEEKYRTNPDATVTVVCKPPHPRTRFRAYYDPDEGVARYFDNLSQASYSAALAGDFKAFSRSLAHWSEGKSKVYVNLISSICHDMFHRLMIDWSTTPAPMTKATDKLPGPVMKAPGPLF